MKNLSQEYYTPIQLKMPVEMERMIAVDDPVYSFNEVMSHIDLQRYFVAKEHKTGRPPYDREKLLKVGIYSKLTIIFKAANNITPTLVRASIVNVNEF